MNIQASKSNGANGGNAKGCDDRSIKTKIENELKLSQDIISLKHKRKYGNTNNITTVRSNNVLQALDLPTVVNFNPRSIYNKIDEFHALVDL